MKDMDLPSLLQERPVHWSGGGVECRWVDHGHAAYTLATFLVSLCDEDDRADIQSGAKRRTLPGSNHGQLGEADIVAYTQPNLAKGRFERGDLRATRERVGLL